jgi:hypothetical protein
MQFARMVIAGDRAEALLARTKCRCPVPAVIHNALGHNLGAAPIADARSAQDLNQCPNFDRTNQQTPREYGYAVDWPRSEIEIIGLWSARFSEAVVRAGLGVTKAVRACCSRLVVANYQLD